MATENSSPTSTGWTCDHIGAPALDDSPGVLVKDARAGLVGYEMHNASAADAFVQFFNADALADVNLGTTVADYVVPILANDVKSAYFPTAINFDDGIVVFSTTAHNGSSAAIVDVWLAVV